MEEKLQKAVDSRSSSEGSYPETPVVGAGMLTSVLWHQVSRLEIWSSSTYIGHVEDFHRLNKEGAKAFIQPWRRHAELNSNSISSGSSTQTDQEDVVDMAQLHSVSFENKEPHCKIQFLR
jgi:hypothetical protein